MKIKRTVIMEIKKFEILFEGVSSKKSTFKFCIDRTIICSFFGGGEPQHEAMYSYWLANVSESNFASNRT